MTKRKVKYYVRWLTQFCVSEAKALLSEGKIALVDGNIPNYEVLSFDDRSYEKWGYFSKIGWRSGHRQVYANIRNGTNLHGHLTREVSKHAKYKEFIKSIGIKRKSKFSKIIQEFHWLFYLDIRDRCVTYEPDFINEISENLLEVIRTRKVIISNLHMVAGISVSKTKLQFNFREITFIVSRPTHQEFITHDKTLKLPMDAFSSWIELRTSNGKAKEWPDRNLLLSVFSLYKLGSVFSLGSSTKGYYAKLRSSMSTTFHKRDYYKYRVGKSDKDGLEKYYNLYFHKLQIIKNLQPKKKVKDEEQFNYSLKVAIERYEELMYVFQNDNDKRIAFAIMGLEALFNTSNDKETIGFKLRVRCANILKHFGMNAVGIEENVKRAYTIRSKYAHGSMTLKDSDFNFEEKIVDYLRISILIVLGLKCTKLKFVNLLNKSLYDDIARKELEKEIVRVRDINKINIGRVTLYNMA